MSTTPTPKWARKRSFNDYADAEDFVNEIVFGGDDQTVVGELTEVWPDEESFTASFSDDSWGRLWAVWGTEEGVDAELEALGEFRDDKGRTGRADVEEA